MTIDESRIIEDINEPLALACLLADGQLGLNNADISWIKDKKIYTTCVFVLCSDIFAWGCADAEQLVFNDYENPSEIIELYKLWKENNRWGSTKWCCLKRNEQPQKPVKDKMIKENYWDETLEVLPENKYDKACKEHFKNEK